MPFLHLVSRWKDPVPYDRSGRVPFDSMYGIMNYLLTICFHAHEHNATTIIDSNYDNVVKVSYPLSKIVFFVFAGQFSITNLEFDHVGIIRLNFKLNSIVYIIRPGYCLSINIEVSRFDTPEVDQRFIGLSEQCPGEPEF